MWNFNELAKKAQELQEQANLAASTFSATSGFSLNLDAMQNNNNNDDQAATVAHRPPVVESTPQIKPVLPSQIIIMDHSHEMRTVPPRPIPKGKLQIPKAKQTMQSTATITTDDPPTATEVSSSSPLVPQPELVQDESSNGKDSSFLPERTEEDANAQNDAVIEKEHQERDDLLGNAKDAIETQNHTDDTIATVDDTIHSKESQLEPTVDTVQSHVETNNIVKETPDESSAANGMAELPQQPMESRQPLITTGDSLPTAFETAKQSLVLLVSSSNPNSAQHSAETVLRSKSISYETIDVMDVEAKMMIDDLLSVSGISNEFPQFFLIDLSTGDATFWGGYSRFQKVSEDDDSFEKLLFSDPASAECDISSYIVPESSPDANKTEILPPEATPSTSAETLLDQFTLQLKRLEDNHQTEMIETERRHAQEIESIKASINHDECEAARIHLEERLLAQIREKEERLHDVIQRNEGYQLKLDVLKREVEGTQALLEAKNSDMGKFSEENLKQLRSWEKKVNEAEAEIEKAKEQSKALEISLEESKKELSTAYEEHENLRERLKTLASELKARRTECRQLKASIDEITQEKTKLTVKIENLEFQLSDRDRSGSEKYEEIEKLSSELSAATAEVEKLRKIVNEKDSENERLLSEYKRKTQSALAMANSRTASAIQSKEEAELEARAARSTADSAMERVVQAELKSKEAVAEARATVKAMTIERDEAMRKHEESAAVLEEKTSKIEQLQNDLVESRVAVKGKEDELAKTLSDLTSEKTRSLSYQKDLADLNSRINLLRDEVKSLREKLRHAEAAASTQAEQPSDKKSVPQNDTKSKEAIDSSTVAILQQELRDANQVIHELKEALQNAVEVDGNDRVGRNERITEGADPDDHQSTNGNNDSIPLFYAMEKQAELNVARNEITRLANLLSNAQAQKMEALDAAEDMRRKMEDAEARLMRFEKLRPSTNRDSPSTGTDSNRQTLDDSGAVNIEYLKNIMLRYLNATSLSEKRALVPVIGAVLCLTHEEQQKAIASLEESVSIGGVGSTLFESFSGKLTSK